MSVQNKENVSVSAELKVVQDVDTELAKVNGLEIVDFAQENADVIFTDSLKTCGFAVLTNTSVPTELIQSVYEEWRTFMVKLNQHAQQNGIAEGSENLADKFKHDASQSGYFPCTVSETAKGATLKDLKHMFQCYFPHGQYPQNEVSQQAYQLWCELIALGKKLVGWIDKHMPADVKKVIQERIGENVELSDCVSSEQTMLRILHYPGNTGINEPVGAVRAAAHEDINLITVLPCGSSRGLQVLKKGGDVKNDDDWFTVPLLPGSIIINIGDMMDELSSGAYRSTTHRVIKLDDDDKQSTCAGDDDESSFISNDRMATPCFIHMKPECPISDKYGSAQHHLMSRLVHLGHVKQEILDQFLETNKDGKMKWDPKSEKVSSK